MGTHMEEEKNREAAPALISVHPSQNSVAVSIGSDLRVFDLHGDCVVNLVDDSGGPSHKDCIRAIRYGANGSLFVSAGDDKLVKIWSTHYWHCITTVCSEKRVSAVAISNDSLYVCFADKFGVVWVVDLHGLDGSQPLINRKAAPLLAHYCSIITSLEFSPDGRVIVSADRDFKIRVTVFPKNPLDGAHEIQSFCLAHTEFVSCLAFLCSLDHPQGFLVSGSGDSTVRLWEISAGSLLDTCDVGTKAGLLQSDGSEEVVSTVTALCTIADTTLVAVAIQSLRGIMLLSCDLSAQTLSIAKVVSNMGESFIPTSLGSSSAGLLWMVTGASNLHGFDNASLSRVKVISGLKTINLVSVVNDTTVLDDNKIPGGVKLLEKLQGHVCVEEKVFLLAAEAVKTAMSNLLIKKQYSSEKREFRKRTRNDRKIKVSISAAAKNRCPNNF
ncbi:WD40 domain-containing protein [Cephalotus follicularis]|uniref:tRNA (guanine-N(7)-)-methyltransferase non-catalytic subunit n=1 Tax=Cephalotus follicularis TaxID=3775 RepID=A0A1Q3CCU8_CEPFO|nr:WD40 domain-containing protein [Cephalotus follicularis]